MKKLAVLLFFALSGSLFLTSCGGGDDDDPSTPKPKPTVTWKTDNGFTFQNATVPAGQNISFGILTTPSSSEKITRVKITLSVNGGPEGVLFDSTMNLTSYNRDWLDVPVGNLPGAKNKYTATVTQSNNESSSISFIATVSSAPKTVSTRPNITMGGQNNTTNGSFFRFESQDVVLLNVASSNPEKVDIIYYYGNTNKATFSAADDAQIGQVFNNVPDWSVKNATRFRKTTLTSTQFDAITDGSTSTEIDNQATTGTFSTKAADLQVGNVIVFVTANGVNYGLARINAIDIGGAGDITFDIKIAQ